MIRFCARSAFLSVLAAIILTGLYGCGSSTTVPGGCPDGTIEISVRLVDQATSQPVLTIDLQNPGRLEITVRDSCGNTLANTLVKVTTTKGTLSPSDGLALTDNSGRARINLSAGGDTGVGVVTVTADSATAELFFQIGGVDLDLGAYTGAGGAFVEKELELSSGQIPAGGTATVTAILVDENEAPFSTPVQVNFSSDCVQQGTSTIDSPVTSFAGEATATYRADNCVGNDTITATVSAGGSDLSAEATIYVEASPVTAIEFVSATPSAIFLEGTGCSGCSEVSTLVFKVVNNQGNPAAGVPVDFALSTEIGGLSLNAASSTSNAAGLVEWMCWPAPCPPMSGSRPRSGTPRFPRSPMNSW